jgi:uncharacterized protein (TIGR02231 family)
MYKTSLLVGILLSVSLIRAQGLTRDPNGYRDNDTSRADATITHATVYFGYGAELTHESKVKVTGNTKIIVINQLSTNIDPNSLQISCPEDVALLSHRYSLFTPVASVAVKSREIIRLEDSVKLVEKSVRRIENLVSIEQEIVTRTGTLIEATVRNNGSRTLSGAEVLKLVEYYNAKIDKSKTAIFNYTETVGELNEKISNLRTRIELLPDFVEQPKPYGQLVLQVMCTQAAEIPISLSYYTNRAGWTPVYDVRVNSKTNKVKLVYKASVMQASGISWKKTKLTLSTGTPNFGVTAPVLSPWYLQLYVPGLYTQLQKRAAFGNELRNNVQSMRNDDAMKEVIVQGYANSFKVEKPQGEIDPSTLENYTTLNEGQLNTNFEIDLPYDIESNGELHSVSIKNEVIDCILKNYAVPRSDKEAYLLAEVADWQKLDLLPGDANIIMDDTYIGKSIIDPNTTADTLNLSLGKDKRISIKRSLVKELSSVKTSGKDSKQVFTYEIVLKNNKTTDVNLLLKDQHPLSTLKEVEVKLDDDGNAMVNPETGVLTWKVSLKAGEIKKFRFSYTVKYPKDTKIVNLK